VLTTAWATITTDIVGLIKACVILDMFLLFHCSSSNFRFPRYSFVLQNLRRTAAMVAVQDWYLHHALLVEGNNGALSNCWMEGDAVGFARNKGSVGWRECYSAVEEGRGNLRLTICFCCLLRVGCCWRCMTVIGDLLLL
jgi:hypothetical protein